MIHNRKHTMKGYWGASTGKSNPQGILMPTLFQHLEFDICFWLQRIKHFTRNIKCWTKFQFKLKFWGIQSVVEGGKNRTFFYFFELKFKKNTLRTIIHLKVTHHN